MPKDEIEKAYARCAEEDELTDQQDLIKKLLEKKHFDRQNASYEERRKMVGFLYRKGFGLDDIYEVVGQNGE